MNIFSLVYLLVLTRSWRWVVSGCRCGCCHCLFTRWRCCWCWRRGRRTEAKLFAGVWTKWRVNSWTRRWRGVRGDGATPEWPIERRRGHGWPEVPARQRGQVSGCGERLVRLSRVAHDHGLFTTNTKVMFLFQNRIFFFTAITFMNFDSTAQLDILWWHLLWIHEKEINCCFVFDKR